MRDILPTEAAERRALSARCRRVFEAWGYGEIVTPAFEYLDLLSTEVGEQISREMFRFVDSDGSLVALRPEMTTSIARAAAQRLRGQPGPVRLSYVQNVFREEPAQRGQQREFWQAGVELLSARGPAADMEVVAVAAEALEAAGLPDFTIGIGQVGVFRSVLESTSLGLEQRAEAERLATARNLVALRELLAFAPSDEREAVLGLVSTRGGREAIEKAGAIVGEGPGRESLEGLAETYRLLDSCGLGSDILVDFGIIRNFDYYTGFVMEIYAPGMGFPLGAGGRYDALLAEFGAPMPAAGFAVGLERLHIAIAEQGEVITGEMPHVLVAWESDPADALCVARELRAAGVSARLALDAIGAEELAAAVHERNETALLVRSGATELLLMGPTAETRSLLTVESVLKELAE